MGALSKCIPGYAGKVLAGLTFVNFFPHRSPHWEYTMAPPHTPEWTPSLFACLLCQATLALFDEFLFGFCCKFGIYFSKRLVQYPKVTGDKAPVVRR